MISRYFPALLLIVSLFISPLITTAKYLVIPPDVNRTWLGPDFWANRLQDWHMRNERIECTKDIKRFEMRTAHITSHWIKEGNGQFEISLQIGNIGSISPDSKAGLLIGAAPTVDYRAASLVHHAMGPGAGYFVGINGAGELMIQDMNNGTNHIRTLISKKILDSFNTNITLELVGRTDGDEFTLYLKPLHIEKNEFMNIVFRGKGAKSLTGNIALVSHPGEGGKFWFNNINLKGQKIVFDPARETGPILSAQHTLSNDILKLTAQFMPVGKNESQTALLQVERNGVWETIATSRINRAGFIANFRVENWNSANDVPYRVTYVYRESENASVEKVYGGVIRRDPVDKETIVVAGFTGNHNTQRGVESKYFNWNENGLWFPHNDIVDHVAYHKPDVLFFSGDQIYEGASPTHPDRKEAYMDLLYKWYLWCWAFRDLTRDTPVIAIPDDHDVYQGNLWGAGGPATDKDDKGGYVMPAEWVKWAERIQVSNLPDPYDPTPIEQGIGVYYTNMKYGGVSFAILEDRKFKSGCDGLIPGKTGRADHVDKDFDVTKLDQPHLKLLGDRQLAFLDDWAQDWRGVDFKVALSQTVFANAATLHGANLMRLHADLDSNGWPQSGRKRALEAFRKCYAFMYGGDQHLATVIHHGIDTWNDAGWSFTVPSIANFYPRAWVPLDEPNNPVPNGAEYTGEYKDGLGNHITMYAHTNPGKDMGHEPKTLHDRMPGYGIIRLNKETRDITIENWPRFADPREEPNEQYEGWPIVINQLDNYGKEAVAYLPEIQVSGMDDAVVQVINESSSEILYTLRINGSSFKPKVFSDGKYTVKVGELGTDQVQTFTNVESIGLNSRKTMEVSF